MKVPLLDLKPQLAQLRDEIVSGVTEVIDSTRYIQGPEVDRLENEVAKYCRTEYAIGVSSGTDALLVTLMSLGIGRGDRVIIPPFSFFATMGVVLRVGAEPVFADIDPVSFNIDPEKVEEILENDKGRTIKAIMPVHLYGQCADMQKLTSLAEKYGVFLIEDAAQAIGAETVIGKEWFKAGAMGTAGCFSFFPSKNLGGIGDGGMVVTSDRELFERIKLMRNHGAYPKYYHALVGGNFRLDPVQAVVIRIKLNYLESWHEARRKNADFYNKQFEQSALIDKAMVALPSALYREEGEKQKKPVNYHIYNQYILRVKDRDNLRKWLAEKEIGTEVYYPVALHQQECINGLVKTQEMPNAEKASQETVALPIYPELTEDMQMYVVESIAEFYS